MLSVSSSRADVGVLAPVWWALTDTIDTDLHIFLTGMHQAKGAPSVDGVPDRATVHTGGADLGGETGSQAADAMASITHSAGDVLAKTQPQVVLIIGDRLDMLPAAVATLPFNLPLVHLHGGEITEGAVDDRIRHALSKMAHLHCVSSESARARLQAMGEADWRITVTGAPGLDTLLAAPELSVAEFVDEAGLTDIGDHLAALRLVTVHPETNAPNPLAPLDAVLGALDARPNPTLITAPNNDPGGGEARRRIDHFVAARPWAVFIDTLGRRLYPNALRHASVMVGNSSSGIIEAGLFGLPVIDVGDRQTGRQRGENVIDVTSSVGAVLAALDRVACNRKRFARNTIYGDGAAAPRIAMVVRSGAGVSMVKESAGIA